MNAGSVLAGLPPYPWPRGMRAPSRSDIESLIEGLIAFLDDLDGDADAEPALGSIDATSHADAHTQEGWNAGYGEDREGLDDNGVADFDGMAWVNFRLRRAA